jgi:hypothetical protein
MEQPGAPYRALIVLRRDDVDDDVQSRFEKATGLGSGLMTRGEGIDPNGDPSISEIQGAVRYRYSSKGGICTPISVQRLAKTVCE